MVFEVGIGTSQNWNPEEAGKEVIIQALSKLSKPPKFVLLFSTIHYEKNKGFQKILDTIYTQIPKETPLVGGTVAAFISREGVFIQGVAAIAFFSKDAEAVAAIGRKTKLKPKKAAADCANTIRKKLVHSKFKNKTIINLISAPIIAKIPILGTIHNINSKVLGNILSRYGVPIAALFGTGLANENEIIKKISEILPEYYIIGGSSVDSGKMLSNFQFYNNKVFTNSIVAMGLASSEEVILTHNSDFSFTDRKFEISSATYRNRIVTNINGKPARSYFLDKIVGLDSAQFKSAGGFYYKTADYFPITFEENPDNIIGIGGFLGENIVLSHTPSGKQAHLLNISGMSIIKNIEKSLKKDFIEKLNFGLLFSSTIYLFILGRNSNKIKENLDAAFGDKPYITICPMVENFYDPRNKKCIVSVYSFNLFSLGKINETK